MKKRIPLILIGLLAAVFCFSAYECGSRISDNPGDFDADDQSLSESEKEEVSRLINALEALIRSAQISAEHSNELLARLDTLRDNVDSKLYDRYCR